MFVHRARCVVDKSLWEKRSFAPARRMTAEISHCTPSNLWCYNSSQSFDLRLSERNVDCPVCGLDLRRHRLSSTTRAIANTFPADRTVYGTSQRLRSLRVCGTSQNTLLRLDSLRYLAVGSLTFLGLDNYPLAHVAAVGVDFRFTKKSLEYF